MKRTYLKVTQDSGRIFFTSDINGPFVMLNLLKFADVADFSSCPELKPEKEMSGRDSYRKYMEGTKPFLDQVGSEILFEGKVNDYVIGPLDEKWDMMLMVKHKSKEIFLKFASNKEYLKVEGYRTAALTDSRLLPMQEGEI